jgi:hypothetical protein
LDGGRELSVLPHSENFDSTGSGDRNDAMLSKAEDRVRSNCGIDWEIVFACLYAFTLVFIVE